MKMSDILDEIIDMLPPATMRLIMDYDKDYLSHSIRVSNSLQDIQKVTMKQTERELRRKIVDIKSKTEENRHHLLKLKKELEVLKSLKEPEGNAQIVEAYTMKMNELESQIRSITKGFGDLDLSELFTEVEDLNQQVEEHRKKLEEARSQYQCYDGFPPDIEQGKKVISEIKERIKQQESAVEAMF